MPQNKRDLKVDGPISVAWDHLSRLYIQTALFREIVRQIKLKDLIQKNDRLKKGGYEECVHKPIVTYVLKILAKIPVQILTT